MKTIVAIGGSVIKTAYEEIKEAARKKLFDVLIHNGGSIFHDFQRTTESLQGHSYPLDKLLEDYSVNKDASLLVWVWIRDGLAPSDSLTHICHQNNIPVLMFTGLGCDFWQLFNDYGRWEQIARRAAFDFQELCNSMKDDPFRFICMGSAVIHPEVFTKALAVAKPQSFTADVVDFLPEQYRPKTRVACFGTYHHMTHKEFLKQWLAEKIT